MVVRIWIIAGAAFIVVAWLLTVPLSPRPYQGSAPSHIEAYRAEGYLPEGALVMSRSIGHEVFEVPSEDAEHAQMTGMSMPSGGDHAGMPGMSMPAGQPHEAMPAMEPDHAPDPMPGMTAPDRAPGEAGGMPAMDMQKESAEAHGQMPGMTAPDHAQSEAGAMTGMDMQKESAEAHGQMPGMTEPDHAQGEAGAMPGMDVQKESAEAHGQMPGMAEPDHAQGEAGAMTGMAEPEPGHGGGGEGLRVLTAHGPAAAHAREVRVQMREWGFEPSRVDVTPGEVLRLVVRNDGNTPHEFMLMSHAAMAAVNYRLQRADWNLLEHEALYEREIVMPGDAIEVTLRVEQPGAWMFMCMFPYHMQFGMMGTMATEGQGMDMGGMQM